MYSVPSIMLVANTGANQRMSLTPSPPNSIRRRIMPLTFKVVSPADRKDIFDGLINGVTDVGITSCLTRSESAPVSSTAVII